MGKSDNSNEKMVAALLVGAAISGALALLFAPYKGKTTRKKLFKKGKSLKGDFQDKYEDLLKGKKEVIEKIKE
ncbi:MAG: YtxH domain-containing protein [Flavobacteriales bacterium]|nr:MAG: YtxH domain-containing protein [Flavobacteriales bacterium]